MGSVEVKPKPPEVSTRPQGGLSALLNRPVVLSVLLAVATLALYYPVHGHPFTDYDDRDYVTENPQVQSGVSWSTVKWAFTTGTAANWHPLTWLSHALDCQLFGQDPAGHHDINVLFHTLNAVLLFWVLLRATGFAGRSFMVAALFALHPINVESVAWIAERKNVLSTMFFLLALGAYRWYVAQPGVRRYSAVAVLFALGLMSKPQIITFPFVLLLWDYWPLERMFPRGERSNTDPEMAGVGHQITLFRLIVEKIPLFVLAAGSAVITLHVQHLARMWYSRHSRVENAILSYALYLKDAIWPRRLALFYPHPDFLSWWSITLSGSILLAISTLVILGRRHRYLPVGWFWFLGTLVPMLGIVQVGAQAMADRYAYISFLGLFIMACWGAAELASRQHLPAPVLALISLVLLLVLSGVARRQINYWQSDETLWAHALRITTGNWVAESQLGSALAMDGKVPEAMPHFYRAIAIVPDDASANMGIAIFELKSRNFSEAIHYYQLVVQNKGAKPDLLVNAWIGMTKAYLGLGEHAKAEKCLEQAHKVKR